MTSKRTSKLGEYNRKGFGVHKEHDKWYYRDPVNGEVHGPLYTREEARRLARYVRTARKEEHK